MTLNDFETFKRIHSRQNRELVRLNVAYARHIRKLEDELHDLRAQYFEQKRQNLELQRTLSTVQQASVKENRYNDLSNETECLEIQSERTLADKTNTEEEAAINDHSTNNRRETRTKPRKCYTLPSVKRKLRKGDPFTFGNS